MTILQTVSDKIPPKYQVLIKIRIQRRIVKLSNILFDTCSFLNYHFVNSIHDLNILGFMAKEMVEARPKC